MRMETRTLVRITSLDARIVTLAWELWGEDEAAWWFETANANLEGDTPAQRMDQGHASDVLQVLEALATSYG